MSRVSSRLRWWPVAVTGALLAATGSLAPAAEAAPSKAAPLGAASSPGRAVRPPAASSAVPADFSPMSATYVSTSQGWVLGSVPCRGLRCYELAHTTDDGAHWSLAHLPAIAPQHVDSALIEVRFADSDDGWIYSTEASGGPLVKAWSTHDGGARWSVISWPVHAQFPPGVEDLEASRGTVHAALQVGDGVDIVSSPVGRDDWRVTGGPFELGAGPVPDGELALQGDSGWFVEVDRVVVSGARLEPSGRWTSWTAPCSKGGGPEVLAAPTSSRLYGVCTEGVWTGQKISVDLFTSTDGGLSFATRALPLASPQLAAATGTSPLVVATLLPLAHSTQAELESSSDGGRSWRPVYRGSGGSWQELGFTTSTQGVAILSSIQGVPGTMLKTTDGGAHWSPVHFG